MRPITRPRPLYPKTVSPAVRLGTGRVDYDRRAIGLRQNVHLGRQNDRRALRWGDELRDSHPHIQRKIS